MFHFNETPWKVTWNIKTISIPWHSSASLVASSGTVNRFQPILLRLYYWTILHGFCKTLIHFIRIIISDLFYPCCGLCGEEFSAKIIHGEAQGRMVILNLYCFKMQKSFVSKLIDNFLLFFFIYFWSITVKVEQYFIKIIKKKLNKNSSLTLNWFGLESDSRMSEFGCAWLLSNFRKNSTF